MTEIGLDSVLSVWNALDVRKRAIVGLASVSIVVAVLVLSSLATRPSFALLYSGLESSAAGEVVNALEQRGVAYKVEGSSIFVESGQRDRLRLTLATEGLPANSSAGYELLDGLDGFGTTSQMFDAAYWRAKEGELARTIVASPQFRSARVHIATPVGQGFRRNNSSVSASAVVYPMTGELSPEQAGGLRYLVSSAVAGLDPERVSVIDGGRNMVVASENTLMSGATVNRRSEELKQRIERLLSSRVGIGRAVVEVSVEMETDRESIVQRQIDPSARVEISSDTRETTSRSSGTNGGAVTVASNLPDGDAGGGAGESQSENTETSEVRNFDFSETTREILRSPGAIKRITVAALVDGVREVDNTGAEVWRPRTDAELTSLQELIQSAVGYDADRGDVITIKSLEFESPPSVPELSPLGFWERQHFDLMRIVQIAILSAVVLGLGMFVIRPIFANPASGTVGTAAALEATPEIPELPSFAADSNPIDDFQPPALNVVGDFDLGDDAGALPALGDIGGGGDSVSRLKQMISDRQDDTMEVLRGWIEGPEEKT